MTVSNVGCNCIYFIKLIKTQLIIFHSPNSLIEPFLNSIKNKNDSLSVVLSIMMMMVMSVLLLLAMITNNSVWCGLADDGLLSPTPGVSL